MENSKQIILNQTMDEERALYNLTNSDVACCIFDGPADGESALKEARNIIVKDCQFKLRYPMWHVDGFKLNNSVMTDTCRAALWYSKKGEIINSHLGGIKALRECSDIMISNTEIVSDEFGWKCKDITIEEASIISAYAFLDSRDLSLRNTKVTSKYSFQYVEDVTISNSGLITKDAFWHSKNVTVVNSIIEGEYLGWYSEGLTLINCKIIGTQPLCYCKDLKLVNCVMENTDLAFEYSDVEADINGHVDSIKNPKSGIITLDSVGEIIRDNPVMECTGEIIVRQ